MKRLLIALATGVTIAGCAQNQPPTVAALPTAPPTRAATPAPALTPIVIQSNEAPPPAMFRPAPDVPIRAGRSAPAMQPRRPTTAQQPRQAPAQTEAQTVASLNPRGIARGMGNRILSAESPRELLPEISALYKLKAFYQQQTANPTLMNRRAAAGNAAIVDRLLQAARQKLNIVSGNVPMESSQILRMNNENFIKSLQQGAEMFGSGDNAPDGASSGDPMNQETFGAWTQRQRRR